MTGQGLAFREAGQQPQHHNYPTTQDYVHAWHLWRAIKRDAELTNAERDVRFWVQCESAGLGTELARQMTKPY